MPNGRPALVSLTSRERSPVNTRDPAAWPFVDRVDDLAALVRGLAAGRGAYVVGPWGVGKSRLVDEAAAAAGGAHRPVGDAAVDGAHPPAGGAGGGGVRGGHGRAVVRLRASAASAAVPLSAFFPLVPRPRDAEGPDLRAVFNVVVDQLAELPGERPGDRPVLVIDDAHLLDGLSAALTLHLATHRVATVVVTVRSGAPVPDALTALWADGLVDRVDLGPLPRTAVAELAERALGGAVDPDAVDLLWAETAGNPLLLRELILAGLRDGQLREDGGRWRATGPIAPGVALCELADRRVADLGPGLRTALELVAVAGARPLDAVEPAAVEALQRAGLVTVVAHGRRAEVRMAEPFLGAALRTLLGPVGERGAATELSAGGDTATRRRRDDLLRDATWQLRSGRSVDPDLAVSAARRAIELADHAGAAALARAALRSGDRIDAALVAAEADIGYDRPGDAVAVLAAIRLDELDDLDAATAARYVVLRGIALGLGLGRIDDGLAFAKVARRGRHATVAADALAAVLHLATGRLGAAYAAAEPLTRAGAADPAARGLAVAAAAFVLVESGRPVDAAILGEAALAGGDAPAAWLLATLLEAYAWAGDVAGVDALIEGIADDTDRTMPGATVSGGVALAAGRALLVRGDLRGAFAWLDRATTALAAGDPLGLAPLAAAAVARAHALRGDVAAARAAAERAAAGRGRVSWHVPEAGLAEVWLLVADGDADQARARALELADAYPHLPRARAVFLYDAMRIGGPDHHIADALAATTAGCASPLLAAMTEHARAHAQRDADALLDVSHALERHGALAAAADAAAHAADPRLAGQRIVATATRRAHALAARTGAAPTPALATLGPARRLSDRERDVVRRAAAGRSNRAIAGDLSVSVRTVEAHLYSAYAKLGVAGRADLGSVVDATTDD